MAFLSLIAKLGLDSTGFQVGLKRGESQALAFSSRLKGAVAGAFGTAAIAAFTRHTIQTASSIKDQSEALGVSVERLQELKYAADQTGGSVESVGAAMKAVARAQAEALQRPDGDAAKAFERLGISGSQLRSMNFQQLFEAIAKSLEGGANNTNLMSAALAVMGKNSVSVLPMMFEGLAALTEEARNLGVVMAEDVVNSLDDVGDAIDRAKARLTTGFGGALATITGWFSTFTQSIGAFAAGTGRYFGTVFEGTRQGRDMKEVAAEAAKAFQSAFDDAAKEDVAAEIAQKDKAARRRNARERAALELPEIEIAKRPDSARTERITSEVNALQRIGAQVGTSDGLTNIARRQLTIQQQIERNTQETARRIQAGGAFP